jgi:alcohol dehydrogenase
MLAPNFIRAVENPSDLDARARMQFGACLAGLAIENSMLGAAHALANPLTAAFGIPHGQAVAIMLPHVVRHNGQFRDGRHALYVDDWYGELWDFANFSKIDESSVLTTLRKPAIVEQNSPTKNSQILADWIEAVSNRAGLAAKLSECGVSREEIPELAASAAEQWTGTFNPVRLTLQEFQRLYASAY